MKDFEPELDKRLKHLLSRMLEGVQMVKRGLYLRLLYRLELKYETEKAKFLAAAIINTLFSDSPSTKKAEAFLESNRNLIKQEISDLQADNQICNVVTQAARVKGIISHYLGTPGKESLINPLERLKELGILVPGGKAPEPGSFLSMATKFQEDSMGKEVQRRENKSGEQKPKWAILTQKAFEYGRKGKYWKSIKLARKALKLNSKDSEAWRLVGNAYEFLGDEAEESSDRERATEFHRKATEAWEKAKEINPNIIIPGYHE